MATIYTFSRDALLKKIGLSPGKKLFVFLVSAILLTIPLPYAYSSIAVILFVVYSLLSAKKQDISFSPALLLPLLLFGLMALSLTWSIDFKSTLKALSKEASLLFIPIAFAFNAHLISKGRKGILKSYSIGMCLFGLFYLGKAMVRYMQTGNADVFFYHELVTLQVNAIYVSAFFSLALFYFLDKKSKSIPDYAAFFFLLGMVYLLSSKTVFVTDVALIAGYYLFSAQMPRKLKAAVAIAVFALAALVGYYGKIGERLAEELSAPAKVSDEEAAAAGTVYNVSINDALTKDKFGGHAYFNGTAFRVYQARIFGEMLKEDGILLTGYGLNASLGKIGEKGIEHDVFQGDEKSYGYNKLNFHNQYVETFADLGIFGFALLLLMLGLNLKNAFRKKDFVHIAFSVLMIALFLTESFIWRQRGVVFFVTVYCLLNITRKPAVR